MTKPRLPRMPIVDPVTGQHGPTHGVEEMRRLGCDVSKLSPEEAQFLIETLPPMRDPVTGKFCKGKLGGAGGKPGRLVYNFKAIVADYVTAHGGFVEDAIIDVFNSLMVAARMGDVQAAKLLLDRLCGTEPDNVDVAVAVSTLSDTERAARLNAILAAAAARKQQPRITVTNGTNPTTDTRRG